MIPFDVEYQTFDNEPAVEKVWFHITKADLMENIGVRDQLAEVNTMLEGEARQLESHEIQKIIDIVKFFMKLAYGERSADGKRFVKTEETWVNFTQTAVYDAFLFSLFKDPEKANYFLMNLLPADLMNDPAVVAASQKASAAPVELPATAPVLEKTSAATDGPPRAASDYDRAELLSMSQELFDSLVGTDPSKMTKPHLVIAMQRKNKQ